MDKSEVYSMLESEGIRFEAVEHKAVYNMDELSQVELPHPEADAKNLFVRDDKKRRYYLITVRGDKKVDLKAFRETYGTRPLSFASADDLRDRLGLSPGSVTPFGLFGENASGVEFFIDRSFTECGDLIGCHPNDNTATVFLRASDLIRLLEARGIAVRIVPV